MYRVFKREGKKGVRWVARITTDSMDKAQTFRTREQAKEWAIDELSKLSDDLPLRGLGPARTTLAAALLDYAHNYSVTKKGGAQEVTRINQYLAVAGLPVLRLTRNTNGAACLEEKAAREQLACLPAEFARHRQARLARRPRTIAARAELATTLVSKLSAHKLREFCNAMIADGYSPDTIRQEFALLRNMFNRAIDEWHWPMRNPLRRFKLPAPGAARTRRISPEEEQRLWEALSACRNKWVKPYVEFAILTAMRRSEVLLTAEWGDVRYDEEAFLRLQDSKTGPREVPLTPAALAVLKGLPGQEGTERIFPLTPNQLKCAWSRVLKRAGITGLRIHDLRHESASRYAMKLGGNPFLLKEITGHKSIKMLERYVNFSRKELMQKLKEAEVQAHTPAPPREPATLPANVVAFPARNASPTTTHQQKGRSA